jgi:hypothetical protein
MRMVGRTLKTGNFSAAADENLAYSAIAAAIFLVAIANQVRLGVGVNTPWLMALCDRLLDGQTAYSDFFENSLPLTILLYMPPVFLASALGVAREPVFFCYVFALAGASLAASWWIIAKSGRLHEIGWPGALAALASVLILPDYSFGQRDHLALLLAMPLLVALGVRANGAAIPEAAAFAAGAVGGIIVAIRPHYALCLGLAAAYVGWRRGWSQLFGFSEINGAIVAAICALVASLALFPHYFTRMLPIIADVYVPNQLSLGLRFVTAMFLSSVFLIAALFVTRRQLQRAPIATVLSSAAIGALGSYFLQGKGFPLHGYVAVALFSIAFGIVATRFAPKWNAVALFALLTLVGWGAATFGYLMAPFYAGGLFLAQGLARRIAFRETASKFRFAPLWVAGALSWFGFGLGWWALHSEWRASPLFVAEIRELGPHPKIAGITAVGAQVFPLASAVNGQWVLSVYSLLVTDGADRRLLNGPVDRETRNRLESYKEWERDLFMADVLRNPPDAVIVDEDWRSAHFNDARVAEWLSGYRLRASQIADFYGTKTALSLYTRPRAQN